MSKCVSFTVKKDTQNTFDKIIDAVLKRKSILFVYGYLMMLRVNVILYT